MDTTGSVSALFLQAREKTGYSQERMANFLGIALRTYARYESGEREPRASTLKKLEDLLDTGDDCSGIQKNETLDYVPLVAPRLAAGTGEVVQSEETVKHYAFRRDWLKRIGSAKDMVLMKVTGPSMMPTVLPNDMVMVDLSRKNLEEDQLFAIGWYDELAVKRLRRTATGAVEVIADNPTHPTRVVEHDGDGFRIVGRVVWLAREFS